MKKIILFLSYIMMIGCSDKRSEQEFIQQSSRLEIGMYKDEVAAIIGYPNNLDNETIWVYTDNHKKKLENWRNIYTKRGVSGYFLLFLDKKLLVKPLRFVETSPWYEFAMNSSLTEEQIESLIGAPP